MIHAFCNCDHSHEKWVGHQKVTILQFLVNHICAKWYLDLTIITSNLCLKSFMKRALTYISLPINRLIFSYMYKVPGLFINLHHIRFYMSIDGISSLNNLVIGKHSFWGIQLEVIGILLLRSPLKPHSLDQDWALNSPRHSQTWDTRIASWMASLKMLWWSLINWHLIDWKIACFCM